MGKRGRVTKPVEIGERFGTYEVIEELPNDMPMRRVRIQCQCGCASIRVQRIYILRSGRIPTCRAQDKRYKVAPNAADVTNINRPFMRALAVELGYSVHERTGHNSRLTWDWGPKGPVQASHFRSEAHAWANLEEHMHARAVEAERIVRTSAELIRRDQS